MVIQMNNTTLSKSISTHNAADEVKKKPGILFRENCFTRQNVCCTTPKENAVAGYCTRSRIPRVETQSAWRIWRSRQTLRGTVANAF